MIFRGQPVKGGLLPGIARTDNGRDTSEAEKEVIEQLALMGASFLTSQEQNSLELLVLAQHFHLKTRLLDWTSNPLAALWFACSDPELKDVYVYALEADKLLRKDVYDKCPFSYHATRVFQPRLTNPRIVAQEGWFTLHEYSAKRKKFVPLEKNPKVTPHLIEFLVPERIKSKIIEGLDHLGISYRTLFPDLEGLCRYLNWKQELVCCPTDKL